MKKILFGGVAALALVACQTKTETTTVDTTVVDTIKADTIIVSPDSVDSVVVDTVKDSAK